MTQELKDNIFALLRYALLAVGAYLVGKNFLGQSIDDELWQGLLGVGLGLGAAIWGWVDKTATLEAIQSAFRSAISFIGVMLVGSGIIKDEVLQSVLGGLPLIISYLYGVTSKKKNKQIAAGEVRIADLKGVDPQKSTFAPDTTPVKTKSKS